MVFTAKPGIIQEVIPTISPHAPGLNGQWRFDYIFSFNDATAPDSHTVTLVFFSFGCIGLGMAAFKLPTHGLDGAVQTVCVSS